MIEAMADNETWGIRTTSIVRSVGIVLFEGPTVLRTEYFRIDEDEQKGHLDITDGVIRAPRTVDASTVEWWAKPENAEAQETIAKAPLVTWSEARTICGKIGQEAKRIWAKPAMFDLPMLRDLFGQDIWPYWKENDLSTLLAEFDPTRTTRPPFEGIPHNALDDAVHAHQWLLALRRCIPRLVELQDATEGGKIWSCKIGEVGQNVVPVGGDAPMRRAVEQAYKMITGVEPNFNFSGWGSALTRVERDVVQRQLAAQERLK